MKSLNIIDFETHIKAFNLLSSSTKSGLWMWDLESSSYYMSDELKKLLQIDTIPASDFFKTFFNYADEQNLTRLVQDCAEGKTENFELIVSLKPKVGESFPVLTKGNVIEVDDNGKVIKFAICFLDLTQMYNLIETNHKLDAKIEHIAEEDLLLVGRLLGTISHDLNNPLSVLTSLLMILKKDKEKDFDLETRLNLYEKLDKSTKRLSAIAKEISKYAHYISDEQHDKNMLPTLVDDMKEKFNIIKGKSENNS